MTPTRVTATPPDPDPARGGSTTEDITIRSRNMQSIHAELARAQGGWDTTRDHVTENRRLARAVLAHRRAQARAEATALRARQLLALAVIR